MGTLWTFGPGCPGIHSHWNQDTTLFQSDVEYFGHKISKGGVSMILDYVQKIKDWPIPKSEMEVATFLGFAEYYCTFIPQYSALTNQLNGLRRLRSSYGTRFR